MTASAPNNAGKTRGRPFAAGNKHGGRRAGSRNRATLLLDALADKRASAVLECVLKAAEDPEHKDHMRAAELVLARKWPPRKGRLVWLPDLPKITDLKSAAVALQHVVAAIADGRISPEEGVSVSSSIATAQQALKASDLESRMAAIEARLAGATPAGSRFRGLAA